MLRGSRRLNFDLATAALGDLDRAAQTVSTTTGDFSGPHRFADDVTIIGPNLFPNIINHNAVSLTGFQIAAHGIAALDLNGIDRSGRWPMCNGVRGRSAGWDIAHKSITLNHPMFIVDQPELGCVNLYISERFGYILSSSGLRARSYLSSGLELKPIPPKRVEITKKGIGRQAMTHMHRKSLA